MAEWKVTTKYALNATDRRETECTGDFTDWMEPALGKKEKMIPQKGRKIRIGIVIGVRGLISPV